MVKYTPQQEWISRRGVLLWLAFFFIELGSGIFFVSSILVSLPSLIAGWAVCAVLGGGLHLLYLGKPARSWRMIFSSGWKTSWISRGLIFVVTFLALGLANIILTSFSTDLKAIVVLADVFALLTVVYGGFAMNYVNGIPLWNTPLLPLLYLISGLWGGTEVALGLSLGRADSALATSIEGWIRVLLLGFVVLIPAYLITVRFSSSTGQISVRTMINGNLSKIFWTVVVAVGMVVPLAAVVASLAIGLEVIPPAFLYIAIACGLAGDLTMRNLILKCGLYAPLIPPSGSPIIPS
jgi:formate-dependent nitrite reductase membrane component NrfD